MITYYRIIVSFAAGTLCRFVSFEADTFATFVSFVTDTLQRYC